MEGLSRPFPPPLSCSECTWTGRCRHGLSGHCCWVRRSGCPHSYQEGTASLSSKIRNRPENLKKMRPRERENSLGATPRGSCGWHPESLVSAYSALCHAAFFSPTCCRWHFTNGPSPRAGPGPHCCPPDLSHYTSTTNPGLPSRLDVGSPLTSALVPQQEDNMAFGKPVK